MNRITQWNHKNISALNPSLTLPTGDIFVVISTESAIENLLLTAALSEIDSQFAREVHNVK